MVRQLEMNIAGASGTTNAKELLKFSEPSFFYSPRLDFVSRVESKPATFFPWQGMIHDSFGLLVSGGKMEIAAFLE